MKSFWQKNHRLVFYSCWLLLTIMQAGLTEIQDDEAYYWLYSHFPAWGYFDHPPMIAWLIKSGYAIFPNELGVRLIPLLLNLFALLIIENLTSKKNPRLFYAIALSMAVLQLWGFIAVPDIPLIFFTALFFWCYRKFLSRMTVFSSLLLGLSMAFIMYSKYQAILIIFFTFLSNPKLITRYHAWIAGVFALLLFAPHLWWQYQHDWISFKYHLFESNVSAYKFSYTLDYILSQFALAGPIAFFILLPAALLHKPADAAERAMRFSLLGIFIFFLFSSFRGRVEANWTSPALPAFMVLAHQYLNGHISWQHWLYRILPLSLLFVLLMRIEMLKDILPVRQLQERYHAWHKWPNEFRQKTKGLPVVFSNSYQRASKYWFYSKQITYSQNFYRNRMNSFNYWPVEDSLLGKPVFFADIYDLSFFSDSFHAKQWTIGLNYDSSFASFAKLKIITAKELQSVSGDSLHISCTAEIPLLYRNYILAHQQMSDTVRIGVFQKSKWIKDLMTGFSLQQITEQKTFSVSVKPDLPKGAYELLFAINCRFYKPTRNSDKIRLTVN